MRAATSLTALALAALASACTRSATVTDALLTVRFDERLHIDQLRFDGSHKGEALFPESVRPVPASGPLADGQTIAVLLDDALGGETLDFAVAGLRGGAAVAWGGGSGVAVRGGEVPVRIDLSTAPPATADGGAPDGAPDGGALMVVSSQLPEATVATPYGVLLLASGGSPPYQWSGVEGVLPSGLALSPDGVVYGAPATAGSSTFTVKVADQGGLDATRTLTLVVGANGLQPLTLAAPALPDGAAGRVYAAALAASGGSLPYVFTVVSGLLPNGLVLAPDGSLGGTPTGAGQSAFCVKVSDSGAPPQVATAPFALVVAPPAGAPLEVATMVLPDGRVGQAYAATLAAAGGTGPYQFGLAGGSSLPPALALASDGTLDGTPTAAGSYSFTVAAGDGSPSPQAASRVLAIEVAPASPGVTLAITSNTLPGGTVGSPYASTLTATGGATPYTFSIADGMLPPGLALNPGGVIAGTSTTAGTFAFTVDVADALQPPRSTCRR
jgi:hypothetical protein